MARRRYQEGLFKRENEHYYSFFYRDRTMPDGSTRSVYSRIGIGKVGSISELSARREHDRLRQQINRERGSVPTAPKGETFQDVAATYMKDIAPQLSIATVRQRNSHLHAHLLPRFGSMALMAIDVPTLQRFVTELSGKSLPQEHPQPARHNNGRTCLRKEVQRPGAGHSERFFNDRG